MKNINVLITGVHKGLGFELANQFLDDGYTVYGVSRSCPHQLVNSKNFIFVKIDLMELDQIGNKIVSAIPHGTAIDLAILNAGILGSIKKLSAHSIDDIKKIMNVNVWANKVLLDLLFEQEHKLKQIIGISSGAAVNGSGGWGPYSISKAAINILIKVSAHENPDTHFTALAPGLVGTSLLDEIFNRDQSNMFDADKRLQKAKEDGKIQTPKQAATLIKSILPKLLNTPSGDFLDVRTLPF